MGWNHQPGYNLIDRGEIVSVSSLFSAIHIGEIILFATIGQAHLFGGDWDSRLGKWLEGFVVVHCFTLFWPLEK